MLAAKSQSRMHRIEHSSDEGDKEVVVRIKRKRLARRKQWNVLVWNSIRSSREGTVDWQVYQAVELAKRHADGLHWYSAR